MKLNAKVILVVVACLLSISLHARKIVGKVTAVKDGDSIEILYNRQIYTIRLNGIDCPERGQPFGSKARQFTSDMCFGKTVTAKVITTDRYRRHVADIILPNGKILNEELLKAGLAWHYKRYNDNSRWSAMENRARALKRGLWADSNPTPPWSFRRR